MLMSLRSSAIHPSVNLSLKMLVTTALFGFYSSGNAPTGPVVVLSFLGSESPPPPRKKIIS